MTWQPANHPYALRGDSGNTAAGGDRGFTLAELMIVVSLIGLLAVLAVPQIRRAMRRAAEGAFVNDLRIVGAALEQMALAEGDFPPDAPPGVPPQGWEGHLASRLDWSRPTPIGGHWDWDRAPAAGMKAHGCYAGLSVIHPDRTSVEMKAVDARFDDGDLAGGSFQARPNGYIYVLEP